ncbi:hypothetical protein Q31b_58560 [Novipirellula aureliae]|uniref:DUF2442 domain-containing protein n=1 Tax=Novipirellula aureliae TaxID=2527966 RepID=A0A5C6D8F7_9BACT|nr:DUF2442 domain-containing protein [Novipirellula aureliae]TWU32061.1 hypothetical protein Q31b_58560 [Novipirellula aureliae]
MLHVTFASHLGGHRLHLCFNDGTAGDIDLATNLDGPIFEPLRNVEYFANFDLSGPTLEWPNGADFAPEYLRDLVLDSASVTHADG